MRIRWGNIKRNAVYIEWFCSNDNSFLCLKSFLFLIIPKDIYPTYVGAILTLTVPQLWLIKKCDLGNAARPLLPQKYLWKQTPTAWSYYNYHFVFIWLHHLFEGYDFASKRHAFIFLSLFPSLLEQFNPRAIRWGKTSICFLSAIPN